MVNPFSSSSVARAFIAPSDKPAQQQGYEIPLASGKRIYVKPNKDHYVRGVNYGNWEITDPGKALLARHMTLGERRQFRAYLKLNFGNALFGKPWIEIAQALGGKETITEINSSNLEEVRGLVFGNKSAPEDVDIEDPSPEDTDVAKQEDTGKLPVLTGANAALFLSAAEGDLEGANAALSDDADIDSISSSGHSALILAAMRNDHAFAEFLFQEDADANSKAPWGMSPLMVVAWYGDVQMAKLFVKYNADPLAHNQSGQNAFSFAKGHNEETWNYLCQTFDPQKATKHCQGEFKESGSVLIHKPHY